MLERVEGGDMRMNNNNNNTWGSKPNSGHDAFGSMQTHTWSGQFIILLLRRRRPLRWILLLENKSFFHSTKKVEVKLVSGSEAEWMRPTHLTYLRPPSSWLLQWIRSIVRAPMCIYSWTTHTHTHTCRSSTTSVLLNLPSKRLHCTDALETRVQHTMKEGRENWK